jgi:hypothetical protein
MEHESPRSNLQKFFQFGLHKPIDAPDYYHPKFIPFLKKKKKIKIKANTKAQYYKGKELSYARKQTRHYKT